MSHINQLMSRRRSVFWRMTSFNLAKPHRRCGAFNMDSYQNTRCYKRKDCNLERISTLGVQNVKRTITKRNGCVPRWSFSRATHRKETSFWIPLWMEMKPGFFHHTPESKQKSMRCKKSWRGSKCRQQTSMIRGYRSWLQDLINVWTMPATILKNKVM
jgi:hypothetical protein